MDKDDDPIRNHTQHRVKLKLNEVYVIKDHYFFDVIVENRSNVAYDIDQIRFKIQDAKVRKATNFQQIEVRPKAYLPDEDYVNLQTQQFEQYYRAVFVFEKFTFPDDKILTLEISEKQVSGRTVILKTKYDDILDARTSVKKVVHRRPIINPGVY